MKRPNFLVLFFLVVLVACSSASVPEQMLHLAISPAAGPVSLAVLNCTPQAEGLFVSIDSRYPGTFALEDYDLFIRLGEPQATDGFAAQIAWEQIVVILNPAVGLRDLSRAQLADLFAGRITTWDELGGTDASVALWTSPQSDEARQIFIDQVLLGSPIASHALLAAAPGQILAEVAAGSGAAGLLPASWADESVQQIELNLEMPVLAVSAAEPTGSARQLLACLQSATGQTLISENYRPFSTE